MKGKTKLIIGILEYLRNISIAEKKNKNMNSPKAMDQKQTKDPRARCMCVRGELVRGSVRVASYCPICALRYFNHFYQEQVPF